jgi:hypothetical protein
MCGGLQMDRVWILLIVSAILALVADIVTYYLELKNKKKRLQTIAKMKTLNMIRKPINPKFNDFTLDEFIHYEKYEKSELATLAYKISEEEGDARLNLFSFKLDYYWFCIEELEKYQSEILELWQEYFNLFEQIEEADSLRRYLNQLSSLTINAGIEQEKRGDIDTELIHRLEKYYSKLLKTEDFNIAITLILEWYYYRTDFYYPIMNIGTTETELYFLEYVYKKYEKCLEQLKSDSPPTYLSYTGVVHYFYINLPQILDKNYDRFYRYIMLNRITVLRSIGEYEKMSETIYMFYKGQKKKKKGWGVIWSNILDLGTGYGEKPYRLIVIFLILQFIFFFIFYPYPNSAIRLGGIEESNGLFENSIDIIYFNMTTMLSNLYGNIPPVNWVAKLIVILQQVIGFIISGSFIALFLRKLFRD